MIKVLCDVTFHIVDLLGARLEVDLVDSNYAYNAKDVQRQTLT